MDEQSADPNQNNVNVPENNNNSIENKYGSTVERPSYSAPAQQPIPTPDPDLVRLSTPAANPQSAPAFAQAPQPVPVAHHNNPIDIVIQWLTYAFWGWTAMAILFISSMVMSFYITNTDISSTLPYSMAAVLVLLPISLICEFLYRKREPTKKVGASSVIMIIHAVLFALFGVGALVVIVLNAVKLFISGSTLENTSAQVFMYVAGIMFVVFAVLFFRTVIPANLLKFRLVISLFMVAVSISLIAVAAIGPVNREIQTKNDKLIEDNLSYVVSAVEQYYVENNKLPDSLSNIALRGDAAKLQSEKLVSYINETSSGPTKYSGLKYQLCVNYVKADEEINPYMQYDYPKNSSDGYSSYANTYGHAAGKVCYKLTTGSSTIGL